MSRLKFTTEHVIWTEEQWDCIHFGNGSKFNLFGCDRRRFVRHYPKERYLPQCSKSSVKFGGVSVMVFSRILAAGTGSLVRLNAKINATVYKDIEEMYLI